MAAVLRALGMLLTVVVLGATGGLGQVAAQDRPANPWLAGEEAESASPPAEGQQADPSSQGEATEDPPIAADDLQAAQVSYAPLFDPVSVCVTGPVQDGVTIGFELLWSNFAFSNTGTEALLFDYTVTDAEGNSVSASAGQADPGSNVSAQIFTTVTARDALTWEVRRSVTITVTGAKSGESASETHDLACPVWPVDNVAVVNGGNGCPVDPGPYQAGDEFRFPLLIDNAFLRSVIAIDAFSMASSGGAFDSPPPTSLGQGDQIELDLVHVLSEEEIGQSGVGFAVTYTVSYGPPSGSAAEGVVGPFTLTFETGTGLCFVAGGEEPTAPPEPTATAEPTATGEPEPTFPGQPTATSEPAPTTPVPTTAPSATTAPGGPVGSLPDTGSGSSGDPTSRALLMLALLLGFGTLGVGFRLVRHPGSSTRR